MEVVFQDRFYCIVHRKPEIWFPLSDLRNALYTLFKESEQFTLVKTVNKNGMNPDVIFNSNESL
jgi:hypothetical protein